MSRICLSIQHGKVKEVRVDLFTNYRCVDKAAMYCIVRIKHHFRFLCESITHSGPLDFSSLAKNAILLLLLARRDGRRWTYQCYDRDRWTLHGRLGGYLVSQQGVWCPFCRSSPLTVLLYLLMMCLAQDQS